MEPTVQDDFDYEGFYRFIFSVFLRYKELYKKRNKCYINYAEEYNEFVINNFWYLNYFYTELLEPMIRDIVRDEAFLSLKSETATKKDYQIAIDLVDTLRAHADECVGMAANMIGFNKNIIKTDRENEERRDNAGKNGKKYQ